MNAAKTAGPATLALGLILLGLVMLTANITGSGIPQALLKYWPVVLVGLGVEYFVRSLINKRKGVTEATRFHLPTLIVIVSITAAGYLGQQFMGIINNHDLSAMISEGIAGSNYSYTHSFESKPVSVEPGVTKLKLESLNGTIDLLPSPDQKLHVTASIVGWGPSEAEARRRAEATKVVVSEGDIISVSGAPGNQNNFRRQVEISYRIMVPKGIQIGVNNQFATIRAEGLESDLDIRSGSGEIAVKDIRGKIIIENENGQVLLTDIDGVTDIRAGNGQIRLKDITKNVYIRNENGNIDISSSKPVSSNYSVSSQTGNITFRIPEASNATVSGGTKTGNISGTLNLKVEGRNIGHSGVQGSPEQPGTNQDETTGSTVLGKGTAAVNLFTENGSIIIDKY